MTALVSWSGGKDACLALHEFAPGSDELDGLLCILDGNGARSRGHGLPPAILAAQARALGVPLYAPSAAWHAYRDVLLTALRAARERGVTTVVFGDIDLAAHREWAGAVCREAGLRAEWPLWGRARSAVARRILDLGIEALVVCVDCTQLGERFCGRRFDDGFLADLPDGVDPCGEGGQFHTCVVAAPRFAERLQIDVVGTEIETLTDPAPARRYAFARLALGSRR